MSFTTYPTAPNISAKINETPIGALRSFSERCEQEVQLVRELGSCENLVYHCNGKQYIIDLQFVLPYGCNAVEPPEDPALLTTFNLTIFLADRTLWFVGCVYESVQLSCEVGQSLLCTMRIRARERYFINETE